MGCVVFAIDRKKLSRSLILLPIFVSLIIGSRAEAFSYDIPISDYFSKTAVIEFSVEARVAGNCWKVETSEGDTFEFSFEANLEGRSFMALVPRFLNACHKVDFKDILFFEIFDQQHVEACSGTGQALLDFRGLTGFRVPGPRAPGDCRTWIRFNYREARRVIRNEWAMWNTRAVSGSDLLPKLSQQPRPE